MGRLVELQLRLAALLKVRDEYEAIGKVQSARRTEEAIRETELEFESIARLAAG